MIRLPKSGILLRSLLITLLAFVIASIGSISYTIYVTGSQHSRTIDIRLNQLLDTVQSTVKTACFLGEADLAKEVAQGLLSNSEVQRVTITAGTTLLADISRTGDTTQPQAAKVVALERKVMSPFNAKQTVGEVHLYPNPDVITGLRQEAITLAAKQLLWQLLFVTIAIYVVLIVFVVRPVSRISQRLHEMDPVAGDRLMVPLGHDNTELGRLVRDINELSDHLVTAIAESSKARVTAEKASLAKSSFLANMSHEIRTPLAAVIGLARIGTRDSVEKLSRNTFARIQDSGKHLLDIINDILDFSKIEAGKLPVESRPMRLAEVIEQSINLVTGRAAEKSLTILNQLATDLPAWIMGDSMRTRQILLNLLTNAIKFTDEGTVTLTVRREANELRFAIRDEGIGMTPEQVSRLFQAFEQADSSTTRKYGGTGLGLAISMSLAKLMAGSIHVDSSPGHGSTFSLTLPLVEAAAPEDAGTIHESARSLSGALDGFRILAAEDIAINRFILEDMLVETGASYLIVNDGRAAVEQVEANTAAFDVVLMDVQMPVMDGHEATRRIRELAPGLAVIGLTAHALTEERDKCLASGMLDHIGKPIDPRVLVCAIQRWSQPGAEAGICVAANATNPSSPAAMPATDLPTDISAINWTVLKTRYDNKTGFIKRLMRIFSNNHDTAPAQLRSLSASGDYEALTFLAHSLRGIAGNIAADSIQEIANRLETAAREQDPEYPGLAIELADHLDQLLEELERHSDVN